MKNQLKKISVLFLVFVLAVSWGGAAPAQPANSTVLLHPSGTVNGIKVRIGDSINGYPITRINGYDITVDLGKYNVSLQSFRIPYASELWELPSGTRVDYFSWAGNGSSSRSEGASALLANGGNSAYYFFKTAQYKK